MHPLTSNELARLRGEELRRRGASRALARLRARWHAPRRSRRARATEAASRRVQPPDGFFRWVLGLPWVVERSHGLAPGVRVFAVDCPPLAIRRVWLVTGLRPGAGATPEIAVIVPADAAATIATAGAGRRVADLPAGHVLVGLTAAPGAAADVEAFVLDGYRHAMT